MCGRFAQHASIKALMKLYNIEEVKVSEQKNYNIAPMSKIVAVIANKGIRRMGRLHWGLIPPWSRDRSAAPKMINARLETADTKRSFKTAFLKRRCIIPADGFFEWEKQENTKLPWYFTATDGHPMALAAIWETWKGEDTPLHTCTILTTQASPDMQHIHNRMPVILTRENLDTWLNTEISDGEYLKTLAESTRVTHLKRNRVATFVNSVKNEGPTCIEPIN